MKSAKSILVQCCVCKRIRTRRGIWRRQRTVALDRPISHTYCPECSRKEVADFSGVAAHYIR